jgi:hypothetical protein
MSTRSNTKLNLPVATNIAQEDLSSLPLELRRLICPTGIGGRMRVDGPASDKWNLDYCQTTFDNSDDEESDDDDSIASDGSQITIETQPSELEISPSHPKS